MVHDGWVKWHRRLLDHPIMALAPCVYKTLGTLLLMANYQPAKWYDGQNEVDIPRGALVTSRANLAATLHISDQQCRDSLIHLERMGMIRTNARPNRYTVVSICNYERWQSLAQDGEPTGDPRETETTRGERTTIKEEKKKRREEEKNTGGAADAASGCLFDLQGDQNVPDPYEEAQIAIWKFWPEGSKRCTRADVKAILHRAVKANGRTKEALDEYVAAARLYRDLAGDYVLRFKEYARLAADGPVVPPNFNRSNGNGSAKPDHGVKPKLDFHTAKPKDPNAEPIRFDIPKGEMK